MRTTNKAALAATLLALAGCSSLGFENKRVDYKSQAQRAPSLEVPPDLTTPSSEGRYTIPGSEGETVASYSDYANPGKAESSVATTPTPVRTEGAVQAGGAVAPQAAVQSGNAHLERDGGKRWLVVKGSAEALWPTLRAFWSGMNFKLAMDDGQAGVMETEWADSRAKIEEGGIRGVVSKLSEGMYTLPNRDMFRVRVERSKDGASSEIYVTHYGKEQVVDAGGNGYKWQNRANDPELEAVMLQQLMVKLNGVTANSAAVDVAESATAAVVQLIEQTDGSSAIQLADAFDKGWHRVGVALEQTKQNIEDKNRAEGVYFVNTVRADQQTLYSFLGGGSSKPERLFVKVRESNGGCVVSVTADDGSQSRSAQRLLDKLFQQMK